MEEKAGYVLVGFVVFVGLVGVALVTLWLQMDRGSKNFTPYDIYFKHSVSGLSIGSPVKYKGIRMGVVESISISKNPPDEVVVRVLVDKSMPVREESVASLQLASISGDSYIEVSGASSDSPYVKSIKGQVPVIPSRESSLQRIVAEAPLLIVEATALVKELRDIASPENRANFKALMQNLSKLSNTANQWLPTSLKDVSSAAQVFVDTAQRGKTFIDHVDKPLTTFFEQGGPQAIRLMERFTVSLNSFDKFLETIDKKLDRLVPGPLERTYKLQ